MTDQHLIDLWGRLEVEWHQALEHATERQREYDSRITNHLVYHLALPSREDISQLAGLWSEVADKRKRADDFIRSLNMASTSP